MPHVSDMLNLLKFLKCIVFLNTSVTFLYLESSYSLFTWSATWIEGKRCSMISSLDWISIPLAPCKFFNQTCYKCSFNFQCLYYIQNKKISKTQCLISRSLYSFGGNVKMAKQRVYKDTASFITGFLCTNFY